MANEVAVFGGQKPAAVFANDPINESLSDGIGVGYGVIGYRGKVWSLRHRGERHVFTRADDGSPLAFLDVVVLRQLPMKSKSYYPKDSFTEDNHDQPLCASLDGITPDQGVRAKQAEACALCQRNVFKVNEKGRKERECRDYKRLAVLIVPKLTKQLLGAPLMEPVFLRVPAASLAAIAELSDRMMSAGWNYYTYVTRIGFVQEAAHPQMTFKEHVALTQEEGLVVKEMREAPLASRITGEADLDKARMAPRIAVDPTKAAPAQAQIIAPPKAAPKPVEDDDTDSGFGAAATPTKSQPIVIDNDEPAVVDDADSDLDARVAAILKT